MGKIYFDPIAGELSFSPGSELTVKETDGIPTIAATTIIFPNGTLTDNLDGSATYAPSVGGGNVSASTNFGTNNILLRSDGTGKDVQETGISVDDSDNLSGINNVTGDDTNLVTGTAGVADNITKYDAAGNVIDAGVAVTDLATSAQGALADTALQIASNLSDLASVATARTNLGLGTAATNSTGDFATSAQGSTADTAIQPGDAATTSAVGVVELATAAEVTTGTDDTRAITPEAFSQSAYGTFITILQPYLTSEDVSTGDNSGGVLFPVPAELDGWKLVAVEAFVASAGTTGTVDVQIRNTTQVEDMLSTKITIDSGETTSDTAATPAVIDATKNTVDKSDFLVIDVDAIPGTAPQGLLVKLGFRAA